MSAKDAKTDDAAALAAAFEATPADLPEPARRALAEAAVRQTKAAPLALPPELGGRDGPEPVRYGDWEKKGLTSDF